jgi:hypothetical protein
MSPPTPGQARRGRRVSQSLQDVAEGKSYRIIGSMPRTAVYLKVEVDHDPHEMPEQLAEEMCRRLLKMHGVRAAELTAFVSQPQEAPPASSSA